MPTVVGARREDRDGKRRDDGPAQHGGALLRGAKGLPSGAGLGLRRLAGLKRIHVHRFNDVLELGGPEVAGP